MVLIQELRRMLTVSLAVIGLAGCTLPLPSEETSELGFTMPGKDPRSEALDAVFACMKATGALSNQGFAVGPFANDTGKQNSSTQGGTGSFLPNGPNIAIYAIEAVSRAGGIPYDYSNMELVRNIAFVGGESAAQHMHKLQNNNMPNFGINVFATALDFGGVQQADLRIGGIGPVLRHTTARAYYAAHIVQPGSQRSMARGFALYQASFNERGIGVARFFGGGAGTLVTGTMSAAVQEPLQRPSAEGVMVAVAYALLEIPSLSECKDEMLPFEALDRADESETTSDETDTPQPIEGSLRATQPPSSNS